jgi:Universal stress protein UspA and related nucleotide-binding proteins
MYKRILVPIDGSDASRSGLREAIQLAKALGASLRLVHGVNEMFVMGTDYTGMYVDDFLSSLREGGRELLEKAQLEARNAGLEAETQLIEALGSFRGRSHLGSGARVGRRSDRDGYAWPAWYSARRARL